MKHTIGAVVLATLVALGGCGGGGYSGPAVAIAPAPPVMSGLSTASINGGPAFVNSVMHTTYVFDADLNTPDMSNCVSAACASFWPAVAIVAGSPLAGNWTMFTRPDGTMQLAYKGRALYAYYGDTSPGIAAGDGINAFGGVWHVARP